MKYLFIRWLIVAIAIGLTAWMMPGVVVAGSGASYVINLLVISAVFGLVNAIIRPIVVLFTCPLVLLTLGLFTLIINAMMLSLTNWLLPDILSVSGFWTTFWASLIISIISGVIGIFVHEDGTNL